MGNLRVFLCRKGVVMKKQPTVFLAVVMLVVTFFSTTTLALNGDMGNFTEPQTDGSEAYPYLIEDFADFQVFADPANSAIYWATGVHTQLDCDIDLDHALAGRQVYATAVIAANVDISQRYEGLFDGNGHTVRNLTIDTAGGNTSYLALFGYITGTDTEIKNLGVVNVSITSGSTSYYIGGLCGTNYGGVVSDCYATGAVTGGGYSSGTGGLCGQNANGGTIRYCYATGAVDGLTSADYLGGLCGENSSGGIITNCYATGKVSNCSYYGRTGGLCGYQRNTGGSISYCYATGAVTGDFYIGGGLCGLRVGSNTIANSYWDTQTTGTTFSDGGTGKTTVQMHLQSTFTGWNFSTLWWMNEGRDYPKLIWQPVADLDNSGRVNLVDFVIMSRSWLANVGDANYNSICELSGDTTVNTPDLTVLAENWLTGS